ncbi:hypothetical protein PoB_006361300 [Plakobranchus ocellatus]|uniref:Uncharacterized protein n=1 Tax=Plakobranchus ocellatus TaxID=259542 RepID=A0AAV4CYU8_9GAST|nr:hypothetical protein PoB_006361300 [Plakobranchus ocellatus]
MIINRSVEKKICLYVLELKYPVLKKDLDIRIGNDFLKRNDLSRYLGVSLDPQLCLTRHIEGVANSVRERTTIYRSWRGHNGAPCPSP